MDLLLHLVIWILVVGVICWAIKAAPFIDPPFKTLAYILIVLIAMFVLLQWVAPGFDVFHVRR